MCQSGGERRAERGRLEALAKRLKLRARFEGFVTDRARYATLLASADALVHGCPCETFGFSVAEALASGVPVVVPDAGGASDFADPDAAERYASEATPVEVSVATSRLLSRPREALCAGALRAASRVRHAGHHFDALFSLYQARLAGVRR